MEKRHKKMHETKPQWRLFTDELTKVTQNFCKPCYGWHSKWNSTSTLNLALSIYYWNPYLRNLFISFKYKKWPFTISKFSNPCMNHIHWEWRLRIMNSISQSSISQPRFVYLLLNSVIIWVLSQCIFWEKIGIWLALP